MDCPYNGETLESILTSLVVAQSPAIEINFMATIRADNNVQSRLLSEREKLISEFVSKLKDPLTNKLLPNIVDLAYPDGGTYIGEVDPNNLSRDGKGIFWYPKDDVYMGDWKNDTFHGEGVYFFGSGERY